MSINARVFTPWKDELDKGLGVINNTNIFDIFGYKHETYIYSQVYWIDKGICQKNFESSLVIKMV